MHFSEWMDEYEVYIRDVRKLSPSYCKTDEGEVIFVPSMQKTKHPVIVPFGQQAKSWMPEMPKDASDQLVFPDAPSLGASNRALKNMAKRAGINKLVTFHTRRHIEFSSCLKVNMLQS